MIKDFYYYIPVKLVFGEGSLTKTGEYASAYGSKAMIVTTGNFFSETGLVARLQGILKESGVESIHFPNVDPNPLNTQIDAVPRWLKLKMSMFLSVLGAAAQ